MNEIVLSSNNTPETVNYSKEDKHRFLEAKKLLNINIPVTIALLATIVVLIIDHYSFVVAGALNTVGFVVTITLFSIFVIGLSLTKLVLGIWIGTNLLNIENEKLNKPLHLYALLELILAFIGATSLLVINYLLLNTMNRTNID